MSSSSTTPATQGPTDTVIAVSDQIVPTTTTTSGIGSETVPHPLAPASSTAKASSQFEGGASLFQHQTNSSDHPSSASTAFSPLSPPNMPAFSRFGSQTSTSQHFYGNNNSSHHGTGSSNGNNSGNDNGLGLLYRSTSPVPTLSGHQQSDKPFVMQNHQNQYQPSDFGAFPRSMMMGGSGEGGMSGGHGAAAAPITIDYQGLNAAIQEQGLSDDQQRLQDIMFAQNTTGGGGSSIKQRHHHARPESLDEKETAGDDLFQRSRTSTSEHPISHLHNSPTGASTSAIPHHVITKPSSEFRRRSARKASFYSERSPRPPVTEPIRYTFYTPASGLIQAPSLPKVLQIANAENRIPSPEGPNTPLVFSDLLKTGTFWLDILDPSDFDMRILGQFFHVHPLTIEDISTEEVREKYEVFRHYYFVCFRTFDQDYNSGSYLQPASMYSVVLRDGIITFHFRPTKHHLNVLRRMDQLHSHITLTPDWINYAILDDITDSFASPIQLVEYEVDAIDELVLILHEDESTDMLRRIGTCRKSVMTMSRLLVNKADVIRGLVKRFNDRSAAIQHANPMQQSFLPMQQHQQQQQQQPPSVPNSTNPTVTPLGAQQQPLPQQPSPPPATALPLEQQQGLEQQQPLRPMSQSAMNINLYYEMGHRDVEILLYLGDILDHVLTMLQSLNSYDKVLDRSHSNYLAQISLEINQLSNKTNDVVGRLTFFASLIVPMTFLTGLWGMNVHVPGQPGQDPDEPYTYWWCLVGVMALYCVVAIIMGRRYGLI